MSPNEQPTTQDDVPPPEVIRVAMKTGETICGRCGRVWMLTPEAPSFSIGMVYGFHSVCCTPCVLEIERDVKIALASEPWDA